MTNLPSTAAQSSSAPQPLPNEELWAMNAYWRAANYLSVGQIYLLDNPLLREPLTLAHIKPRLLGHWGTTPGLNFIYVHINRIIKKYDLNVLNITGPGHGGPGIVANTYLEGTYTRSLSQHLAGRGGDARSCSSSFRFRAAFPATARRKRPAPSTKAANWATRSRHALRGRVRQSRSACCCAIGDGEAETGPLAASWHSNKFLNPVGDGAVLPILHLNGYKIANPTLLARMSDEELRTSVFGYGYKPYFVEGDEPEPMHQKMAATLDTIVAEIKAIQRKARAEGDTSRPQWPMIIHADAQRLDGAERGGRQENRRLLALASGSDGGHEQAGASAHYWKTGCEATSPKNCSTRTARFCRNSPHLRPTGRPAAWEPTPYANGGLLLKDLHLPDFRAYAVDVATPGATTAEATRIMGQFLRDVMKQNLESRNFRVLSPDENNSNRLNAVLDATNRAWEGRGFRL